MKKLITILLMSVSFFSFSQNRVAVLEDFRGHKCGLCPGGDLVADQIVQDYNDSVIVIAIHAGGLSTPNGSGTHTTDFRTPAGNTYNSTFGILGNPTGVVNRTTYLNNIRLGKGLWDAAVNEIIDDTPAINITIENGYNQSTKELSLHVNTILNQNLTGNYSLIINVLEDSIYDWQTNYNASPNNVQFYLHNHVLRDNINGIWGNSVVDTNGSVGDTILKQFIYTINNAWDENQLSLVAYLYDESTNEILNAKKHHIDLNAAPLTITDTVTNNPQGIVISENLNFEIYPNPAKNQVIVKSTNSKTFNILDLSGKAILSNQKTNQYVNTSILDKGMYLVELYSNESKVGYQKLIIE